MAVGRAGQHFASDHLDVTSQRNIRWQFDPDLVINELSGVDMSPAELGLKKNHFRRVHVDFYGSVIITGPMFLVT